MGRALVEGVVGWARNRRAQRIELWVADDAPAAAALYAALGFREVGVHQAIPYSPRQMEKLLARTL